MGHEPRLTLQSFKVLTAFLAQPRVEFAGVELLESTKLAVGTLYPILYRFEEAGWLTSRWEDIDPSKEGRPRRRLYRITAPGITRANTLRAEILGGLPA